MSNPFDQFDSKTASPAANPFDAFDAPVASTRGPQKAGYGFPASDAAQPGEPAPRVSADAPEPQIDPNRPTSQTLGFVKGILPVVEKLGGFKTPEDAERARQLIEHQATKPGKIGEFAGGMAMTLPATAALGPIGGGMATGALLSDKHDPVGMATDAAVGGIGGKLGSAAIGAAQKVISPVVRPAVQALLKEGVNLTPGQIAGGFLKGVEDKASSLPVVGDMIKRGQANSIDSFNRAVVNRTLKPIGQTLPDNVSTGHDAVAHAQDALSSAYQAVLPKIAVTADQKFGSDVQQLTATLRNLAPDKAKQLSSIVANKVLGKFDPARQMTGETMKDVDTELGRQIRNFRSIAASPDDREIAEALSTVQRSLRDMVSRQNPSVAPKLQAINEGYANLVRVENAASKAKDGVFSPAQLDAAVRQSDSSVRKKAVAGGNALMQDLSANARSVLPSSVPNSGTADRLALGGLGIGAGLHAVNPAALAASLAAAAAYTKTGSKVVATALTQRPAAAASVANALAPLKRPAAAIGSATAVNALTSRP